MRSLPRAEQVSTFHCVTGWTVKDVHWAGVRFRDLLAAVDPLPSAHAIRFVSAERPYQDSLTLDQALLPDTMLGLEMDRRLRVIRVGFGKAKLAQEIGANGLGRWLGQCPPQIRDGRIWNAVGGRGLGGSAQ